MDRLRLRRQARRRRAAYLFWYATFSSRDLNEVITAIEQAVSCLPSDPELRAESEDAPIPFDVGDLGEYLEILSQHETWVNSSGFVSSLVLRIRTMLVDRRMRAIIAPEDDVQFAAWLADHIGEDQAGHGAVAVIDLSLVPSDVVHIVVTVLARLVFEAAQRYRRLNGAELPTVLVLEEAHTFVRRHEGARDDYQTPSRVCRETFQRIAREGRKFGVGLVLASQRPSELSPTVLAQCNAVILHRLVNDRDQDLAKRLVPDNLSGLLRELPTLPTRHAVLLGWATALPVLAQIRELKAEHRPESADPRFWEVWTGGEDRTIDWTTVAQEWQLTKISGTGEPAQEKDHTHAAADEPLS